jgi:hypothetical protein
MAPIAATLSALAATVSAMSPAKLAAFPIAAGLAVGTAAGVTYATTASNAEPAPTVMASVAPAPVVASAPAVAPAPAAIIIPETKPAPVVTAKTGTPCAQQTWPYIDANCRVGQTGTDRKVRIVMASRASDMPTEAKLSSDLARKDNPGLVSSSTVLNAPQPLAEQPKVTKRSAKRDSRRARERSVAQQYYQVPSEYGRGNARIVVRPSQFDPYR